MRQLAKKLATKMGSLWEDMADMDGESKVGGAVEVARQTNLAAHAVRQNICPAQATDQLDTKN